MRKSVSIAIVVPMALAACTGSTGDTESDDSDGGSDVVVKLHPLEQYCVEYEHEGMLSGTSKNCIRKWGTETVTIEDLKVGVGGMTQDQKAHKITIGETVYVIDPDKLTGTRTKNPMYMPLAEGDAEQLAKSMMDAMKLEDTGEDKEIAGTKCNVFKSEQLGGGGCYTDDMVPLELDVMGAKQVATSVDLDSGGSDADYSLYERAEITEGPDVGAIMDQL